MSGIGKRVSNLYKRMSRSKLEDADEGEKQAGLDPVAERPQAKPGHANAPSLADKLMGAPLSLLVAGLPQTGKGTLVDRVFGLTSRPVVPGSEETDGLDGSGEEHIANEDGFVKCLILKKPEAVARFITGDKAATFDLAWIFVDSEFGSHEVSCVEATLGKAIPTLVCVARADEKKQEEVDAITRQVRSKVEAIMKDLEATATKSLTADPIEPPVFKMPAFDIIQVRNAPPPICIECEGKTERKVVKDMPTMIGLNCINPECDIYNAGPFKLQDIPTNEPFDHKLHAKCKALLHGKSPEMRRYQIAQLIDKTSKYAFAQTFVITTTLIAAGIGANPIPFVDAPLLIATQLTLVNSICSVYGFRNASTYWGLAKNVLATPILGLIGADMIKILPGLGTIVGGIADVIICATMTISLGIATVRMCDGLLTERNARGNGIGEGRPVFVIDAAVGKVFKEVYTSTKDAIKSLARNGKLSKESLMGMMESNGGVKLTEKPDEDDLEGAKELEGLAHDLVIHEREEVLKESPGKEGAATETPSNVVGGNPVDSDKVEIAVSAEVVD